MPVSVLILTLNEEVNLPGCLAALSWCDDVVVLDSHSTDRTVEIAEAAGARVVCRPFDNWSAHQNWAVENIGFRHPWVYYSDADERMPEDLREELQRLAGDTSRGEVAYRLRFKNMFMGRWLRRSSLYPTWVLRFFRPECVRWERLVNPTPVVSGREGRIEAHFEHFPFNKGIHEWLAKHNNYSSQEAVELIKASQECLELRSVFSKDPALRRKTLKQLAYRLPGRPLLVFGYLYVLRLGFLDGMPGLVYCVLRSMYEFMIDVKVKEILRRNNGLPV